MVLVFEHPSEKKNKMEKIRLLRQSTTILHVFYPFV